MDIQKDVAAIERMLETFGIPLAQFCNLAEITPRSWRNWREGSFLPQLAKWQQVLVAVEDLKTSHRVVRKIAKRVA